MWVVKVCLTDEGLSMYQRLAKKKLKKGGVGDFFYKFQRLRRRITVDFLYGETGMHEHIIVHPNFFGQQEKTDLPSGAVNIDSRIAVVNCYDLRGYGKAHELILA